MEAIPVIRRILLAGGLAALAGCASQVKPLYLWESFPRLQYSTLQRSESDPTDQIQKMEAHATKAKASNSALPPGFRAHLGMMYMNAGNTDAAIEMWKAEKAAFPESAPYMDQLLRRMSTATKENKEANPT